ncbi:hypothetical protein ACFPL7_03685 [Dongia soli]|uniref:Uncharacterized protein n=1 Tax=Dongia soli TaxID=600628 RepID=A0ABU5EEJ5_9PROT|nr:hypothetical protein [Dongia soli]MDY0884607.1 hypothetical protein [Dongia soli]
MAVHGVRRKERPPPTYEATPRGEVVSREDTPEILRNLVERRSMEIRDAGSQKSWPDLSLPDHSTVSQSGFSGTAERMGMSWSWRRRTSPAGEPQAEPWPDEPARTAETMSAVIVPSLTAEAATRAVKPLEADLVPEAIAFPDALRRPLGYLR